MRVIAILIAFIMTGCATTDFDQLSPLSIKSVEFEITSPPGEYGLFECVSSKYSGTLILIGGSEKRFCIKASPSPITGDFGVAEVGVDSIKICKWVETGYCENGVCDSIYVKNQCVLKKI